MCSIIIFSKQDNDHEDPAQDWKKFKAGDVVDIHEKDNFYWGDDVQGQNPLGWWTVVSVPKVQRAQVAHLMESGALPLVSLAPLSAAEVKHQRRLWRLDLTKLAPQMSLEELLSAAYAVTEMANENVIG